MSMMCDFCECVRDCDNCAGKWCDHGGYYTYSGRQPQSEPDGSGLSAPAWQHNAVGCVEASGCDAVGRKDIRTARTGAQN